MSQASTLSFQDEHGSYFDTALDSVKKWTDINGLGNYDLAPGEIATHSDTINGRVSFVGTFLSTIPFARKYGVLQSPLELWIEDSTIQKIATEVQAWNTTSIATWTPIRPTGASRSWGSAPTKGQEPVCPQCRVRRASLRPAPGAGWRRQGQPSPGSDFRERCAGAG